MLANRKLATLIFSGAAIIDRNSFQLPIAEFHRILQIETRSDLHGSRTGSIEGHCFNCGESWWEIAPKKENSPVRGIDPITTLPDNHSAIANAPPVEVRETPSFRHFSKEEPNGCP